MAETFWIWLNRRLAYRLSMAEHSIQESVYGGFGGRTVGTQHANSGGRGGHHRRDGGYDGDEPFERVYSGVRNRAVFPRRKHGPHFHRSCQYRFKERQQFFARFRFRLLAPLRLCCQQRSARRREPRQTALLTRQLRRSVG